jgi:DNA processing protein
MEAGTPLDPSNTNANPGSQIARKLLELISVEKPVHIDDLLARVEDVSSSEVVAALFELEMTGAVRQLPGKNFVRVW